MSNHNLDLLGHPIPEPKELPHGRQLIDLTELIGHTVKLVFEGTDLKSEPWLADIVIVTETHCFIALRADDDGLQPINPYKPQKLGNFVSIRAMARCGLLGAEALAAQVRAEELERIRDLKESAQKFRSTALDSIRWAERDEAKAAELEAEIAQRAQVKKDPSNAN